MSDFQSIAEIMQQLTHPKRPQLLSVSAQAMTPEAILAWGKRHNWPKLVLAPLGSLSPGRDAWEELVQSNDYVRLVSVSQRIAKWNKMTSSHDRGKA
jgi:hypothetical protein